jgi:holo-[acyl-carrier protein] synthase
VEANIMIGHGIDLVDVTSLKALIAVPGRHFLDRCFTPAEQAAAGDGPNRFDRLAGRFAAKEAVMKALGTGFGGGIGFLNVEILTLPSGAPSVLLNGAAAERARSLGVTRWLVSTSHDGGMAIASAIATGD